MMPIRLLPLTFKYATRHRARFLLTLCGTAMAMFFYYVVAAMQHGADAATRQRADDVRLVVYRQDRFCPFTSQLPQDYERRLSAIPGVAAVTPVKVVVNNCRAGLDVVTFAGVPENAFESGFYSHLRVPAGALTRWKERNDAALVGERLAARRGLKPGDRISLGGIAITVAGILESDDPQDQNAAYTHLSFVQQASGKGLGVVTQFNIRVAEPGQLEAVAQAIDAEFQHEAAPTATWPERTFAAQAMGDVLDLIQTAAWLGWGALAAVFALVANTIVLSVLERVRDHAVLRTLGYTSGLIMRLVVAEAIMLSVAGGLFGLLAGTVSLEMSKLTLTVEGLSLHVQAGPLAALRGLALCAFLGVLSGLVPAWQASRREPAKCFRAI